MYHVLQLKLSLALRMIWTYRGTPLGQFFVDDETFSIILRVEKNCRESRLWVFLVDDGDEVPVDQRHQLRFQVLVHVVVEAEPIALVAPVAWGHLKQTVEFKHYRTHWGISRKFQQLPIYSAYQEHYKYGIYEGWGGAAKHRGSVRASHPAAPCSNPTSTRAYLVLL